MESNRANDMGELPMERGESYRDEATARAETQARRRAYGSRNLGNIPGATDTPSQGPSVEGGTPL